MSNRIDDYPNPLCFTVRAATKESAFHQSFVGNETIKVEARQMFGHQKEALTQQGIDGTVWRIPSDEGLHIHGTDLAPFPLGFFNAGLQGDLFHTLLSLAKKQQLTINQIEMELTNHYWLTGSFILGTGEAHAEPTQIKIQIDSPASKDVIEALIEETIKISPAINFLRQPLKNTFALYINGTRRPLTHLNECDNPDIKDPFLIYTKAPSPVTGSTDHQLLIKLPLREDGEVKLAANTIQGKQIRNILGKGSWHKGDPYAQIETWLEMPGTTHFSYKADVLGHHLAPSGLSLLSSGIAFCFMTQLSRYIENMKMAIDGIRLVQLNAFAFENQCGKSLPIETHLYLNGTAPDEIHHQLITISERTCYLHATALNAIEPNVTIV